MIFSFGQIWPLKTQLCACLRIDYENMAFFLRKNHWVKIWGGGEHFHFWPRTWVVKMDLFGHRGQIWPDQNFFGPICGRHQNSGRNEVWNTSETQKLTEIWLKPFFSENAKKIMDFGGLVCSGSSWELILGFLSGPNASWVSVLPTKPAGKVWAKSKKNLWGGLYKYCEKPQNVFLSFDLILCELSLLKLSFYKNMILNVTQNWNKKFILLKLTAIANMFELFGFCLPMNAS